MSMAGKMITRLRKSEALNCNYESTTQNYTLNHDRALSKKLTSCGTDHLRIERKDGDNWRVYLSTSSFEIVKDAFTKLIHDENSSSHVSIKDKFDDMGAVVEKTYTITNWAAIVTEGSELGLELIGKCKIVINFYYTKSSLLVNGSQSNIFMKILSPVLTDAMHRLQPELTVLNKSIADTLKSISYQRVNTHHDKTLSLVSCDKDSVSAAIDLNPDASPYVPSRSPKAIPVDLTGGEEPVDISDTDSDSSDIDTPGDEAFIGVSKPQENSLLEEPNIFDQYLDNDDAGEGEEICEDFEGMNGKQVMNFIAKQLSDIKLEQKRSNLKLESVDCKTGLNNKRIVNLAKLTQNRVDYFRS